MSESGFYRISPAGAAPAGGGLTAFASAAEALAAPPGAGYLWLHYPQPKKEDLAELIEPLGLHPLSIEDCFDQNQVPKMEDYNRNTFILFNSFSYAEARLSVDEVDLFIGEDYLVTVCGQPRVGQPLAGIEKVVEREIERARRGPAFLLHIVMDYIVDQKFAVIESIEEELDEMEEEIMAAASRFRPSGLMRRRRMLTTLRKSVFHEREILTRICRRDSRFIPESAIFHYRDVYDHLAKFFELVESCHDLVTSLMETYLSLMNNRMAWAAQETNATVRRLTLITTVFMPLGFLAGIFGMSEWTMMTGGEQNWRIAFPLFILAMALLGLANYFLLRQMEKRRKDGVKPPR